MPPFKISFSYENSSRFTFQNSIKYSRVVITFKNKIKFCPVVINYLSEFNTTYVKQIFTFQNLVKLCQVVITFQNLIKLNRVVIIFHNLYSCIYHDVLQCEFYRFPQIHPVSIPDGGGHDHWVHLGIVLHVCVTRRLDAFSVVRRRGCRASLWAGRWPCCHPPLNVTVDRKHDLSDPCNRKVSISHFWIFRL